MKESTEQFLTPPEVAKTLRVSPEKVIGWIRRAELRAVNVGNGFRPRYRISPEWLELFLRSREVQPPPPRAKRQPRRPEGGPIDPVLGEQLAKKGQAEKVGKNYYRVIDGQIRFY